VRAHVLYTIYNTEFICVTDDRCGLYQPETGENGFAFASVAEIVTLYYGSWLRAAAGKKIADKKPDDRSLKSTTAAAAQVTYVSLYNVYLHKRIFLNLSFGVLNCVVRLEFELASFSFYK